MAEPPLLEGAVQLRVAVVLPGVAPRPVGAPGTVAAGSAPANTVPERSAIVGEEDEPRVAVTHCGGPAEQLSGGTGRQAEPFHHSRLVAPLRLQSVMVRLLKLLPEATPTSRYSPDAAQVGLPTGSE